MEGGGKTATTGKMDEQWLQAQAERKEREEREKARAESEKVGVVGLGWVGVSYSALVPLRCRSNSAGIPP